MLKELFRKSPFASAAFGVLTVLLFASWVGRENSAVTRAIFRVGFCRPGNFVCVLLYHFIFLGCAVTAGFLLDAIFFHKTSKTKKLGQAAKDIPNLDTFENMPPEVYDPKPRELKHRINVEAQKLQKQFKSLRLSSRITRRAKHQAILKTQKSISDNLLPDANRWLKDTSIPDLISRLNNKLTYHAVSYSSLMAQYEVKNNYRKFSSTIPAEIQAEIDDHERRLDQAATDIESMINRLIDLSQEDQL